MQVTVKLEAWTVKNFWSSCLVCNNCYIVLFDVGGSCGKLCNSVCPCLGTMQIFDARHIELFLNGGYINGMLKACYNDDAKR
ncbi:hypothetical protein ACS0TY_001373 [Phlomoides rotata]